MISGGKASKVHSHYDEMTIPFIKVNKQKNR